MSNRQRRSAGDPGQSGAGLRAWARRHAYSLLSSLGALSRQPVASSMTVVVLAVALSLPAALHVTIDNVSRISDNWERLDSISVFLDQSVSEADALRLASQVSTWLEVVAVDPVSPASGLAEVTGQLSLGEMVDVMAENPLPWVLEVAPATGSDVAALAGRLEQEAEVDMVIVDLQWLERLDAMVEVIRQLTVLLALLFAMGVAFIIANTIRMDIQNRREEIEVMALVGATPGFIRRPFLYTGLWYGLLGGGVAWLLVRVGLLALTSPIARLSGSYHTNFQLVPPASELILLMLLGSGLLGIIGSWLVVGQHLRRINP